MSALWVQLACLYVCGLIALDTHQTHCRVARFLPARCHDALNRLLRKMAFSTEGLMALLVKVAKTLGEGHLILDDVVLEKFGAACPLVGSCPDTSEPAQGCVRVTHRGGGLVLLQWTVSHSGGVGGVEAERAVRGSQPTLSDEDRIRQGIAGFCAEKAAAVWVCVL